MTNTQETNKNEMKPEEPRRRSEGDQMISLILSRTIQFHSYHHAQL